MKKGSIILFLIAILVFSGISVSFASGPETYPVKQGDSLWVIARKFNLGVRELKRLNGLKSSRLKPGQTLIVSAGITETKAPAPEYKGPKKYNKYQVKRGDSLYKIAKRHHLSVEELKAFNGLESNKLAVGQKLALSRKEGTALREKEEPMAQPIEPVGPVKEDTSVAGGPVDGSPVAGSFSAKEEPLTLPAVAEGAEARSPVERLIYAAGEMLGTPYRFGGNSLLGLDCSAFVKKAFTLAGVALPRTANEQFHVGEPVERESLMEGDLVFFKTYASFPSHVGIYIGSNLFIHASRKLGKVAVESLDTPYYSRRFLGAKRLLDVGVTDPLSLQN